MATITYTIDNSNLPEFKAGFIRGCPIPTSPTTGEPIMTENEWIKEAGLRFFISKYKAGKRQIASEQAEFESDLIE